MNYKVPSGCVVDYDYNYGCNLHRNTILNESNWRFRSLIILVILAVTSLYCNAQFVPYSQYYNTPLLTNPSLAAQNNFMQLAVHYRRSRVANYEIPSVSFVRPFFHTHNGLRAGGFGAQVIRQEAGPKGAYAISGATGTFAYTIHLSRKHLISAGLQGGVINKRLDPSRITTDNQYNFGAFDPSLPNGENFQSGSITKPVINSGFNWTFSDTSNMAKAVIGIAFFNMNRPEYGFISDTEREEMNYVITGEVLLLKGERMSFYPMVRYISGVASFANIGALVRYSLPSGNGDIGAGAWYKTTDAIVGALQYSNEHYVLAASLDFSSASHLAANVNNAFEISFGWRLKRKAKQRSASTTLQSSASPQLSPKNSLIEKERLPDPSVEEQPQEENLEEIRAEQLQLEPELEEDVTTTNHDLEKSGAFTQPDNFTPPNKNSISELTSEEEAVLATRIEFKLGSSELTATSVDFIEKQLVPILKKHPNHILHISGHCCTIGDKEVNEKISFHRAQAVARVLRQHSIPEEKLVLTGMDFQKPIASNETEAGRQRNRRAEFELRKK